MGFMYALCVPHPSRLTNLRVAYAVGECFDRALSTGPYLIGKTGLSAYALLMQIHVTEAKAEVSNIPNKQDWNRDHQHRNAPNERTCPSRVERDIHLSGEQRETS